MKSWLTMRYLMKLLLVLPLSPSAAPCVYFDGFKNNADGTVTDPRSKLVWQRCAAGQTWGGGSCAGKGEMFSWDDAIKAATANRLLGASDWRLPTLEELKAVVGANENCLVDESKKPWRAVSTVFPAVREDGFVGSFWSSTPFTSSGAWVVNFFDGSSASIGRSALVGNARFVRP